MTTPIDLSQRDVDLVETGDEVLADFPRSTVFTAATLAGPWEVVEFLYCDSLKVVASPQIDECRLSYHYGPITRENDSEDEPPDDDLVQFNPLDLLGKFCKVVIADAAEDGEDLLWYGVIETDGRKPLGSVADQEAGAEEEDEEEEAEDEDGEPEDAGNPRGTQEFTAFGLARLLELTTIMQAVVNVPSEDALDAGNTAVKIAQGLSFNGHPQAEYDDRGNMSRDVDSGTDSHIFSETPQGGNLWDAYEAALHLLNYHQPADASGEPLCAWELDADPAALGWYDVTIKTDSRTVKQVLDDLINRKRGVSWYVTYAEAEGEDDDEEEDLDEDEGETEAEEDGEEEPVPGIATLHVFTFLDAPLTVEEGEIAANPDLKQLDFENAFDVEVTLTNSISQQFDRVVALGAFRTSTATLPFASSSLAIQPDWSSADEQKYKDAASADADYAALEADDKYRRNRRFRATDQLKHVYRRFRLNPAWPQFVNVNGAPQNVVTSLGQNYAIAPRIDTGGFKDVHNGGVFADNYVAGHDTEPLWVRGVRIEPKLPFKDRSDYSGSKIIDGTFDDGTTAFDDDGQPNYEFLKPFFFVATKLDGDIQRYELLDKLNENAVDEDFPCKWSVSARVLDHRPAFDLNVAGAMQTVLAKTAFAGAAGDTDPQDDPAQNPGLCAQDFTDFFATLTLRLQTRLSVSAEVNGGGEDGQIERVHYINVPDARLDYVLPWTVVAITNATPTLTNFGGFVRDDRPRLEAIATSAAQWYGRTRQTLEIAVKQIKEVVKLGWLITDVGPNYQLSNVNTPITGITYDFTAGKTTFQTSFADLEFAVAGE